MYNQTLPERLGRIAAIANSVIHLERNQILIQLEAMASHCDQISKTLLLTGI